MRYSKCKEINDTVLRLVRAGWRIWRGGAHYRIQKPGNPHIMTVPGSPSDHRAAQNFRAQIRRIERK